jgi:acyl-CoA synthetase (NDP forming)
VTAASAARTGLDALFAPRSVAVLGASPDLGKPGGRCVAFLRDFGYPGEIYPVNPRHAEIAGLRAFPTMADLPEPVDLVIVLIDAEQVPRAVEQAALAGARSALVCSSGFREIGPRGAALERELAEVAARHGIRVMGPNSLGYIDVAARLPATFSTALQYEGKLRPGPVVLVSQSGAMGAAIFGVGQMDTDLGVGAFFSTGNEAALSFGEVLDYVSADNRFRVLLGYVEGLTEGRELVETIRRARTAGKDVCLLKVGRSEAGRVAARSHTGALAGDDAAWNAALDRAGAIRAFSPQELLDVGIALNTGLRPRGKRVGIVSMSGGAGVLLSDYAVEQGLEVAALQASTLESIRASLPELPSVGNPLDFGPAYTDPDAIRTSVRLMAEAAETDMVVVFLGLSPNLAGTIEADLAAIATAAGKPLILAWLGGPETGRRTAQRLGIPTYPDPIRAMRAAAALCHSARGLAANPRTRGAAAGGIVGGWHHAGRAELTERETKQLLAAYGIPVVMERFAASREEASAIAADLGGRLVVKAEAPTLWHKSDAGAVVLDVGPGDVAHSFDRVVAAARAAGAAVNGVVIQRLAPPGGVELLIGARWDDQFGTLIVVGAGGVTSDVARDVRVDLAPVDVSRARELISGLRIAPILGRFRGRAALDVDAAADALAALSRLASEAGRLLAELDVNPLIVYERGSGCLALDAAALLTRA